MKRKLTCGFCLHLTDEGRGEKGGLCGTEGKLAHNSTCSSFAPNVHTLRKQPTNLKAESLRAIGNALAHLTPTEVAHLGAILQFEPRTRKSGFRFHQRVYIRVQGTSASFYMNDFAQAFVLSVDKERIRLLGNNGRTVYNMLMSQPRNVWTAEEFAPIRERMVKNNAFVNPATIEVAQERIPSIDELPPEVLGSRANKNRGLTVEAAPKKKKKKLTAEQRQAMRDRKRDAVSGLEKLSFGNTDEFEIRG